MKLEDLSHLQLPFDKKSGRLKAASFDHENNRIILGFRKDIIEYDASTGSRISSYNTESEITHLEHAYTGGTSVLVASLRNGCFSVIDLNTRTLSAFHIPTKMTERAIASVFSISRARPLIFYARQGSSNITGIEIFCDSKNSASYPHKKPISALTVHPSRSLMCSGSVDGVVKIWETETHTLLATFDECVDKKSKVAVTALCFHRGNKKNTDILVTGNKSGRVQVWAVVNDVQTRVVGSINLSHWITSLFFHPTLPCFFALTSKGCLRAISINHIINAKEIPTMKGILSDFDMIQPLYVPIHDSTYRTNSKSLQLLIPTISATINQKTGAIVFYGKNFQIPSSDITHKSPYCSLPLYNVRPSNAFAASYSCTLSDLLLADTTSPHKLRNTFIFIENVQSGAMISEWNMTTDQVQPLSLIKPSPNFDPFYKIVRTVYSEGADQVLIFYQRAGGSHYNNNQTNGAGLLQFQRAATTLKSQHSAPADGMDGGWLGSDKYLILSEDSRHIHFYNDSAATPQIIPLTDKINRVFCFAHQESHLILYHSAATHSIAFAHPLESSPSPLQLDTTKTFKLRADESIIDLQYSDAIQSFGVMTDRRILILNNSLKITSCVDSIHHNRIPRYNSILWCASALLFNSVDTLYAITSGDYQATPLCTMTAQSKLVAVMPDRLLFASNTTKRTKITPRHLSLAEPLIKCIVAITDNQRRLQLLRQLVDQYDCRSISLSTLLLLQSSGHADLASELISCSVYNFTWDVRFEMAKSGLNLNYAIDILKIQFESDSTAFQKDSNYHKQLKSLADLCMDYGQFQHAETCYEMMRDYDALLQLYVALQHHQGLTHLSEVCKNDSQFHHIHIACQVIIDNMSHVAHGPLISWSIQPHDVEMRDYNDLSTALKNNMQIADAGTTVTPIYESNDLNVWMGQGLRRSDAINQRASVMAPKMDFQSEFGGNQAAGANDDTDTASSVDQPVRMPSNNASDSTGPAGGAHQPTSTDEMTNPSEAVELDADGYVIRNDQQDARKNFVQDSSEDDSSGDEAASSLKKKKKALRGVRIDLDKATHAEADADTIRMSLGGLSLGAPLGAAPNRRRLLGRGEQEDANNNNTVGNNGNTNNTTVAPAPSVAPALVNINPAESLKQGMALIEKGKYKEARPRVNEAIEHLSKDTSQVLKKTNLLLCTQYKLLIAVLLNIQRLDAKQSDAQEIARAASLLPQINTIPKHKTVCCNMAVKRNLDANNYGISAEILRQLEPTAPPQFKQDVVNKIQACEQNGCEDDDKELGAVWRRNNGAIRFCWKTFDWIEEEHGGHLECGYCGALFIESDSVEEDDKCSYCTCGELVKK
ncbi:U3 small nucleolar RNA-associated protein 13 [Acrasis kona]|uniref:U3 small nucleolar RNA-associated protein 13 n=1 Tax=Acrasis kona TaxID=1008807 RepID=A0AAW2YWJ4_9EUKA